MDTTRGSDELQRQIIEQVRISLGLLGSDDLLPELDQLSAELRRLQQRERQPLSA